MELPVVSLLCNFDSEDVGDGLWGIIELLGVRVPVGVGDDVFDEVLEPDCDKDTTCKAISRITCHTAMWFYASTYIGHALRS